MSIRVRRAVLSVGLGLLLLPRPAPAQDGPRNLQYFPADMPRAELVEEMRQFSFALGVRCQYCHIGGDGVSFEGVVFESDDDPDKRKARYMLRLVETLNNALLPMMADRDEPPVEISCKTCHRGLPKPALLTDVVRQTLDEHGADSARAEYARLRETTTLSGMFDFGQWEMNTLGDRLAEEGRTRDAIAVFELNAEYYPESVTIWLTLGQLYEEVDEPEAALRNYRRVLELSPGQGFATERVRALSG